jgi:hypothetical protein
VSWEATAGSSPTEIAKGNIFKVRNWSLDFFSHVYFLFNGMAELTSFGSFFFDQPRRETTSSRTPLKEDKRSYPKKEFKTSWEALLYREAGLRNGITK